MSNPSKKCLPVEIPAHSPFESEVLLSAATWVSDVYDKVDLNSDVKTDRWIHDLEKQFS